MDNLEFVPNSQVEGFDISQNTLLPGDNSLNNDISLDTSTDGSFQDPLASNEITPITLEQDFMGEISESEIAPIQLNNLDTDGTVDPLIGGSQPQAALSTTFETNETGVFTVNATGEFTIDFLFDAGSYRSEFAVFSLKGMEELTPGSSEYIKEATRRALTNSEEGYVIIADGSEGARFTGELGESDKNGGNYSGIKTYSMKPGDDFAFMLVPQGKLQEVFDNPAIDGDQRPLFSIASANPGNATQMMQLLDGTADGGVFGIEDLRLDQNSDADYNDIIFHVKGAAGKATPLVDVVNPGNPWYETAKGGELLDFAATNNIFDQASEITIGLVNDTGSSQTDGITNDPLLSGSISNVGQVASFKAGFNGSQDFIDISDSLKSDGSFSLDNEKLEQINNDSLADGDRLLTLQAEDASGNVLNTTNFSFTLDTQVAAPINLIVSGVDGSVTNDNTPTITGEAEAGSKVELFNGGQFVGETTVNSPWEITTVALADGVQSITAKATDVAGNVSTASQTLEFTVDTVAPQLNITSPVADAVLSNGARLTGKLDETGAGIVNLTYQFGGADAVTVPVNENGEFDVELDLTGLSNGTQTLTIATTDLAGNTTSNEISVNLNLDVTAPVITASLATDSGSSDSDKITNNPAITGSVTDNSEITSFKAGFDDTATENFVDVLADLQADGSFSFDAAKLKAINGDVDLSEGEHTLKLIASDTVGNVSEVLEFSFSLDTQSPNFTINSPSVDGELTEGSRFTGSLDETGSGIVNLTYQFSGSSEITVPVNENGEFDVELDLTGLSNGTQTLTITTTDLAGNTTSNEISVNVNLDVTAPVITASLATDSGSSDSDKITNNPAITGSVTDNSQITSFKAGFDDTATENFVDVLADLQPDSSFSFDAAKLKEINGDADLSEGEHTLKLIATDAVGNVSEVLEFTFSLDTQLPSLTVNNPSADQELTSGAKFTGTIDGTGSEIASLTYQFNAGAEITVPVNENGEFDVELDLTGLSNGTQTLTITTTDLAGNLNTQDINVNVNLGNQDTTAPVITASLTTDTGSSDSDKVTSNAEINGTVTDSSQITSFTAGFDDTATENFVDVLADLQPDGSFSFDIAKLAEINGNAGLSEGEHILKLVATDAVGNVSEVFNFSFTLDTFAPIAAISSELTDTVSSLDVTYNEAVLEAFTVANYTLTISGGDNDGQTVEISSVEKVSDTVVRLQLATSLTLNAYQLAIANVITDLAGNAIAENTTIDFSVNPPGVEISPTNGEELVALTRETIVRFNTKVDPSTVNDESFYLIANGERLNGRIVVSTTEEFATFFYDEPLPQSTEVRVVVDGDKIKSRSGIAIDGNNDGIAGGIATADFTTLPLTRIEGTNVWGYVYDSYNTNEDGSNIPLEGVVIRLDSLPDVFAVTDENGYFKLEDVPAPDFFVYIDGSNVKDAPAATQYASLGKPFHSVPGQEIQLEMDGEPFDVYLPAMAASDIVELSDTEDTNVGFGEASLEFLQSQFPDVDPEAWQQTQVTFVAGSATDDTGNTATQAMIVPVDPERLPAPLPPGANPGLVISIQAGGENGFNREADGGATNFDVPAPVTFPNLEGLEPGEKSLIWTFNHDAGDWEIIGTGTVSEDGKSIVSDEGVGIRAPGWHFTNPGTVDEGNVDDKDDDEATVTIETVDDTAIEAIIRSGEPNTEESSSGSFVIKRTGDIDKPLSVKYTIKTGENQATPGDDYDDTELTGEVEFEAGSSAKYLEISPIADDDKEEGEEEVTLELENSSDYKLGSETSATVTIGDSAYVEGIDRWWATAGDDPISVTWTVFVENETEYGLRIDIDSSFSQPWNLTDNATVKIDGEEINNSFNSNRFISLGTLTRGFHEITINSFDVPEQANVSEVELKLSKLTQRGSRLVSSIETFFIADQRQVTGIDTQQLIEQYKPILHFDKGDSPEGWKPNGFVGPFSIEQTWGAYKKPGYDATGNRKDKFDLGNVYVDGASYLGDGTIYASILENKSENELAINYYFHYPRSNWQYYRGNNTHEGDWEGIIVFLRSTGDGWKPNRVAFSQHVKASFLGIGEDGGTIVPWEFLDVSDNKNNANVYVSLGAHASYPFSGITPYTRLTKVFGRQIPNPALPKIPEFHKGDYRSFDKLTVKELPRAGDENIKESYPWLLYSGLWGDDDSSPRGPFFLKAGAVISPKNPGQRWLNPWEWSSGFQKLKEGENTSRGAQIYLGNDGTDEILIDGQYGILRGGTGDDIYTLDIEKTQILEKEVLYIPNNLGGSFIEDTSGNDTLKLVFDNPFPPELHLGLSQGKYGFARDGKNLIIDNNRDGKVRYENDVTIVDFFESSFGEAAGNGFIEKIEIFTSFEKLRELSGEEIRKALIGDTATTNDTVVNALTDDTTTNQSILNPAQVDAVTTSNISTEPGFNDDPRSYYRYVLDDGNEITGRTDVNGKLNAVLPPNTDFDLFVYSTRTNRYEIISSDSGSSGSNQNREIELVRFGGQDTDGDGLPDVGEFTIGTDYEKVDTDGDGISDTAEIEQGLDPLGGRGFPTGIISSLPLQGQANAITVEGSTTDTGSQTAYVATGSHGLAIVDASQFDNPIILGQLDLPGDATDVAVDTNLQMAAIATNTGGLQLVDVSDPMLPVLSQTVNISANKVEVVDGIAYATVGTNLKAIDLLTGDELQELTLPGSGTVTDLAREGNYLYTYTSGSDTFSVVDITNSISATVKGQVNVSVASSVVGISVGNGVAYLGGSGLRTIDISDPSNPTLIGDAEQFFTARDVTLNGSGLALVAAEGQGLGIYNFSDPTDTDNFITQIDTPGFTNDIAIASGIAFVADGSSGLQVINYLNFDNQGQAPTVTISSPGVDLDPDKEGTQVLEGTSIPIQADVQDDVQVRNVELLVNGEVVSNDVSFPFDLTAIALNDDPEATTVDVQVRATDTGGNSTLSNTLTFDLVPDTFAPEIETIFPGNGEEAAQGLRRVTVRFNESLDETNVSTDSFKLLDSNGEEITAQNIQLQRDNRTVQLTYESLPVGEYSLVIEANQITDRAGNVLGEENVISNFTLVEGTIFWVGGSGDWNDPSNWNTGEVPGEDDIVFISAPGDATINFNSGSVTVANLFARDHLEISGGSLTIKANSEFSEGFTLSGGTLDVDGELSVAGESNWTGGTITGDRGLTNTGTLNWLSGTITGEGGLTNTGTLNIVDGSFKNLYGVLNNSGTIVHNTSTERNQEVSFRNGTINNLEGGIYDFQQGTLQRDSFSRTTEAINNSGTFRKSGEETASVNVAFNNNGGTIDAQQGTLRLSGGTSTGGNYTASEGGFIDYVSNHTFSGTYTGEGEGKVRINSGTISVPEGETANFNLSGSLFEWVSGTITGGGELTNSGTFNIVDGSFKNLYGVLNNSGTIVHNTSTERNQEVSFRNGTINNLEGGIYDFQQGTLQRDSFSSGTEAINNSGTFRKSGEETASVNVAFNNNGGTIDAQQGTLRLSGGGTSAGGNYTASEGGFIDYTSGTHTFSGTYTGEGEGKVRINRGTISVAKGETANFNLSGNLFEWVSGTITGDGGLSNSGTLNIVDGSFQYLRTTLNNTGTIVQHGGSTLRTSSSSGTNYTGAINNSGTFRKSGEGNSSVSVAFNNNGGTIDAEQGTLQLSGGGTNTDGNYTASEGGSIDYTSRTHTFSGNYTGEGEGKVRINGATISETEGETANFNLSGNLFEWVNGTITGNGGLSNSGTLNIVDSSFQYLRTTLNNTGTIVQHGGSTLRTSSSSGTNYTGAINNSGTFRKSGEGNSSVSVAFNNNGGTIDAEQGTLQLSGGGTNTGGNYTASEGGFIDYVTGIGGTHTFSGTYTGEGEGKVRINGGTISVVEGETAEFNLSDNLFEWTRGTIAGEGELTNTGTLNIADGSTKYLRSVLNNSGIIVHNTSNTDVQEVSFNGGTLNNLEGGIYDFQQGRLRRNSSSSATGEINNSGTFRKNGEGTAYIYVTFNNNGTTAVQQGTLQLRGGGTSSGTHTIATDSTLNYAGGTHTLTNGYSVSGDGTVLLTSGTLDVSSDNGANFNPGNFEKTGGTFVDA